MGKASRKSPVELIMALGSSSRPSINPLRKRLYSIKEAAEYLGRSPWAIRELIWAGKIPSVRVGRRVHLDLHDLDAFIDQNKVHEIL